MRNSEKHWKISSTNVRERERERERRYTSWYEALFTIHKPVCLLGSSSAGGSDGWKDHETWPGVPQ